MTNDDTTSGETRRPAKKGGMAFAPIAFLIALIPIVFVVCAMMATHVGYISPDLGFKTLTLRYGSKLAIAALGVSLLSLLVSIFMNPGKYLGWAIAAVVLSGGVTGGYFVYERALKQFPPIHDVATDWDTPLTFSDALMADRGRNAASVEDMPRVPRDQSMEWGGKTVAQINATNCPAAQPIRHKHLTDDQIADVLAASHYRVFGRNHFRVEGIYQDNFFGFKSDLVVRIDPDRIDLRSTSRADLPDLGGNCRRLTDLITKIKALRDSEPDSVDAPAASAASAASGSAQPAAAGGDDGGGD